MVNDLFDIHERIKYLREDILDINQNDMSIRIGLKQGSLSDIERKRTKTVTDRVINDICREFSVNEDWLRYGQGEMFIQASEFSFDEYAKKNNLSELESEIIKSYMGLDSDIRNGLMSSLKSIFNKYSEVAATMDISLDENEDLVKDDEDSIERELAAYRLELEAEKKGEISSVSENIEGIRRHSRKVN